MSDELKQVEVRLKMVDGESLHSKESISTPEDAIRIMAKAMAGLDREEVCVVNLDAAGHPINFNIVSIGDIDSSIIPVRNVFKTAIMSNASSIILLHNHPSSSLKPSKADLLVTKKMMYASTFMSIPILDHIIVAGRTGRHYSMRENNSELFLTSGYVRNLENVADGISVDEQEVKENEVLYQSKPEQKIFGIYQLNSSGEADKYRFMGSDFIEKQKIVVRGEDYNLIYSDVFQENNTLDSIYERFNVECPIDFKGHSLSVSDVIVVQDKQVSKAYFVDRFGFVELPNFTEEREQLLFPPEERESKKKSSYKGPTIKDITEQLEKGLSELFESDKYKEFLDTMSKFHNYSFNNTLLIAMQKPDATLVASYGSWQKNFNRQVKKGEKCLRIIAPSPYKQVREKELLDPRTKQPVKDANGKVRTENVEVTVQSFKPVAVFDVSQTEGEPLPEIGVKELVQSVDGYSDMMKALEEVSPVPMAFAEVEGEAKGYFSLQEQKIVIQSGMSESQTLKTAVHEISHSLLHDKDHVRMPDIGEEKKSRNIIELEAESVAYTVCQHFGIDTSEYSFSYVAGWSTDKNTKELKESMETIRKTASQVIKDVEEKIHEYRKTRSLDEENQQMIAGKIKEILESNDKKMQVGVEVYAENQPNNAMLQEPGKKR